MPFSLPTTLSKAQWRVLSSYKVNKLRTHLHQMLHPCHDPRIVFIFGCQRSGTTMLRNFIGFDPRVDDQGEGDPPYFWQVPVEDSRYLRILPDEEIESLTRSRRSQVVLLKPLHDSQRATELLHRFPSSKGFWIFRHYREVILSHLNYYRGQYEPLPYVRDLLDQNTSSWKAESLGKEMREFIKAHRHEAVTPVAGFALFWLARNSLLFQQDLSNLLPINYAELVAKPEQSLQVIGGHISLNLNPHYAKFPQRRERRQELPDPIPPTIAAACDTMMERLIAVAPILGVKD